MYGADGNKGSIWGWFGEELYKMTNKLCKIGGLIVIVTLLGHLGGGMGVGLVSLLRPNLLYEDSLFSPWDVWYFLGFCF